MAIAGPMDHRSTVWHRSDIHGIEVFLLLYHALEAGHSAITSAAIWPFF